MADTLVNRNKRAVFGWTMYDWANSVHSLVITTAIFPIYFNIMAAQIAVRTETDSLGAVQPIVPFMGMEIKAISLMSLSIAIAYGVIAIISPLLGAIADYSGSKKKFMMGFCLIGSASCAGMFFFDAGTFALGFWLFVLSLIGYAGGVIFNDAFIPEIAEPKDYDRVSARGFAMGYIGSVILLVFNLTMLMMPQLYFDVAGEAARLMQASPGLAEDAALASAKLSFAPLAMRISFVTVGIWWFGFALVTFFSLKDVKPPYKPERLLTKGFEELGIVRRKLKDLKWLKRFLFAFAFYNMALQTVMYLASSFGDLELKMEPGDLIVMMLLIQIVAIPGSFLFAYLSRRFSNYKALLIGVGIWIAVCIGAYFVTDKYGFYAIGGVVGLIMGGMQALSRSTYSKLVPEGHDNASFFSFYSITDKLSVVAGTLSFSVISQFWGTRNSVLALIAFFLIGAVLLLQLSRSYDKGEITGSTQS